MSSLEGNCLYPILFCETAVLLKLSLYPINTQLSLYYALLRYTYVNGGSGGTLLV